MTYNGDRIMDSLALKTYTVSGFLDPLGNNSHSQGVVFVEIWTPFITPFPTLIKRVRDTSCP